MKKLILIKYDGFFPVEINNPSNSLIQNFCDYLYEINDKLIDPFSEIEQSIVNYNSGDLVAGVILSNFSLCSDPTQSSFRSSNQGATELFNSDFDISGKELVIVNHLWKNPDVSKPDKLFKKYLRAKSGSLVNIDVPLNPSEIGVNSETNFNYPLTNPGNCTQNTTLYEVKKDSDGKYYGYKLQNCVWVKQDIVEIGTPYPTNSDPDQYLFGQKKASTTWEKKATYTKNGNLIWVDYQKKYPCDECYDYSVGNLKNTSTEKLIQGFYNAIGTNWTSFQNERDKLFNSFIFGKGQKVVWQSNSVLSQTIMNYTDVKNKLDAVENAIKSHLLTHDNLNGLFTSNNLLTISGPNPNLSSILNPWMFQMFGGTQGRNIKIVKFKKSNSSSCSGKYYEVQFVFELVDCVGLGVNEKWYLPGIYQQWVLQHYRNNYCCDNQSFKPVVNHKIEMARSFYFCKP